MFLLNQVIWVCNNCRKQQEILTKPGEWFTGPDGNPAGLGAAVSEPSVCQKLRSRSQAPSTIQDPNRPHAPWDRTWHRPPIPQRTTARHVS
ncbi:hypothetical protein KUCAC02_024529 [Chaenocephalus aceratus]|uniref:Uncharacterized protein n=1 Tax=Chaenocephalus aceratus TaxID=36190 RepID=A0ACB9WIY3_CHAAC|nr:hypothetical protein KUCAC02_024529 [Chaenocephalus aceratus]